MTADTGHILRDYLSPRVPALRDELAGLLRAEIPFYEALPEERVAMAVEMLLRAIIDASLPTWDPGPAVASASKSLVDRAAAGLPRDGALAIATNIRRVFLRRLEELYEANLPDVPRLMRFADEFGETLNVKIRKHYDDALEVAQKALRESEARYRELVELSPDGVTAYRDGRFIYINPAGAQLLGADAEAILGAEVLSYFPAEHREDVSRRMRAAAALPGPASSAEYVMQRADGARFDVELAGTTVMFEGLPARQVVFRDVTERKRAERMAKQAALQEKLIQAQAETLRALSTPIIPVSDGVVVMPIIGHVDQARAVQMQQALLSGIASAGAKVAILDVTGVPTMEDPDVAAVLMSAVSAARLLGAEVMLTGIKPSAAQTLVALGIDFSRLVTRGTLKDGIAHAFAREQRR